jgi:hypothetical protein
MLKNSASFIIASLRSSTYRSIRLASSLAAALLNGLFEHPDALLASTRLHMTLAANFQMIPPSLLAVSSRMGAD